MAWQSGGSGGGIPGLVSDGANGVRVIGSVAVASNQSPLAPPGLNIEGRLVLIDTAATMAQNLDNVGLTQSVDVDSNGGGALSSLVRSGDTTLHDYSSPILQLLDFTNSAQPALRVSKGGSTVLELSTIKSITGALSTVADAPAKAVLTSIIATLTGIKVATNNTT